MSDEESEFDAAEYNIRMGGDQILYAAGCGIGLGSPASHDWVIEEFRPTLGISFGIVDPDGDTGELLGIVGLATSWVVAATMHAQLVAMREQWPPELQERWDREYEASLPKARAALVEQTARIAAQSSAS